MQSIASDQAPVGLALTEVLGSKGQVRLLRILALETEESATAPEMASKAGLTRSGARKALRRMVTAGLVSRDGTGRGTRYFLDSQNLLAAQIIRLFEAERATVDPGWAREHSRRESRKAPRRTGNGSGNGAHHGNGGGNGNRASHEMHDLAPVLDTESPEFHGALATLLAEELSLIRRARDKVLEKLKDRHGPTGPDLWEWRKVLETYPVPRLLHFLESTSPRAQRLRRTSPFPEVISEKEKQRLAELAEQVH